MKYIMIASTTLLAGIVIMLSLGEPSRHSPTADQAAAKLQTFSSNETQISDNALGEAVSYRNSADNEYGFPVAEVDNEPEFIAPFLNIADAGERITQLQNLIGNSNDSDATQDMLYAAAHDPDASIRELAYEQLHAHHDTQLETILRDAAESSSNDFRLTAVGIAARLSVPYAVDILWKATEDSHVDVRYAAFQGLSALEREVSLPLIRERLCHADPAVRLLAIETMAGLGGEAANEAFNFALSDDDESIRNWAQEKGAL